MAADSALQGASPPTDSTGPGRKGNNSSVKRAEAPVVPEAVKDAAAIFKCCFDPAFFPRVSFTCLIRCYQCFVSKSDHCHRAGEVCSCTLSAVYSFVLHAYIARQQVIKTDVSIWLALELVEEISGSFDNPSVLRTAHLYVDFMIYVDFMLLCSSKPCLTR